MGRLYQLINIMYPFSLLIGELEPARRRLQYVFEAPDGTPKRRNPYFYIEGTCLNPDIRERLWPYMGGIAKQNGMIPKCIGGVSDHVHLLVTLPTRLAVAKAVQLIKAGSSAWIHQTFPNLRNFAWQQGYGAFSVGISQVQETVHYIEQQLEHHRTRTFQEEYLAFLKKHGAHFDEKYLWD